MLCHRVVSKTAGSNGSDVIALLLYVDDIILTGSNASKVQAIIQELGDVFELKDMGKLSYFLGLQLTYKENGDIFINQSKYAWDLIHKAGMDTCKPAQPLVSQILSCWHQRVHS